MKDVLRRLIDDYTMTDRPPVLLTLDRPAHPPPHAGVSQGGICDTSTPYPIEEEDPQRCAKAA